MNRRELLNAVPGIYVNGRLASKVADGLLAKRALTGEKGIAKYIADQLVMHRTHLRELLTAIKSAQTVQEVWVAEAEAQDFIYLVVQPILDPKCPNCHKLWGHHSEAELPACFNALCTVKKYSARPRVAIR